MRRLNARRRPQNAGCSRWCGGFPLGMRCLDFAHQLVRLFLGHLTTANHVLKKITRAFNDETSETGSGADDVLHSGGHLAARLHADFLRLRCHLGDGIFYISSAVAGAPLRWRWDRGGWGASSGGGYGGNGGSHCWLLLFNHYMGSVQREVVLTASNHRCFVRCPSGLNGAKYMIFRH